MVNSLESRAEFGRDVKVAPLAFLLLAIYTVLALIRPHEFSPETAQYHLIRYFAIASFIFILLSLRPIKIAPQLVMLILMLPLIMISGFLNGWGTGGIQQAERLLISSIVPFFLYSTLVCTPARQRMLMLICIVAALVMVLNGHYQVLNFDGTSGIGIGGSATVGREEMRITYLGFFNDPNDVGMFLVMNIPFAAYFYTRWRFSGKILVSAVVIALAYGIYLTGSRGTILSALALLVVFLMIKRGRTKSLVFLAISAPFVATLLASFGGLGKGDGSVEGRLEAWYAGIQMLIHNPIFGIGMGNFGDEHGRVAHNSYIHVAGELGIPGYSLWGGVLVLNMIASYRLLKGERPVAENAAKKSLMEEELLLNQSLFFAMIGFMFAAFFLSRNYVLTMFIFLGMQSASLMRIATIDVQFKDEFRLPSIFKAMGLAWVIIVAVYISMKIGI